MKSTLTTNKTIIDWNKSQLLQSTRNGIVVITSGAHGEDKFEATIINVGFKGASMGHNSDAFEKEFFTIYDGSVTLQN